MKKRHRLLARQLKRYCLQAEHLPDHFKQFVESIDVAYRQFDEDRALLERSLDLSSRELLRANSEMRGIFEAFPDMYFRLDNKGEIIDFKSSGGEHVLVDPASMLGRYIQEVPIPEVAQLFEKTLERVRQEKKVINIEYPLEIRGHLSHYEARFVSLIHDQIMVIIRDISRRKEAEQEREGLLTSLERSNGELRNFIHISSHDLKSPLNDLRNLSQWLIEDYDDVLDEEGRENLERIKNRVLRMSSVLESVLRYSSISWSQNQWEVLDLREIIEKLARCYRVQEETKIIVQEGLPAVGGHPILLPQVFQNLVDNAVKYMDKDKGRVEVTWADRTSHWEFRVSDNGPGIARKHFKRIFQPFQKIENRRDLPNTGIGLALVKKIVEQHDGTIQVESEEGKGSSFIVTLPKRWGEQGKAA